MEVEPDKALRTAPDPGEGFRMQVDYGMGSASSQKAKKYSKNRRKPKFKSGGSLGDSGHDSTKEMFGQLLMAPMGAALALEVFVAPSDVTLRRVFTTQVCVKMFDEELGPGNDMCAGWNQPLILETPSLEPAVSGKCNCPEWEELVTEFHADFDRVHGLDGQRMTLAREAVVVKEAGEVKAITAVISAHRKLGDSLSELQLYVMAQRRAQEGR
jgi:hypothetical protein